MSDWKPISTAPRDGTFLVWRPLYRMCAVVRLFDEEEGYVIDPITGRNWVATHWMPLPAPPAPEASDE
jgi:hypothetical protein